MPYIQITKPTVIKYEPTDLELYVEDQLKKHDFLLSQHNLYIYEDNMHLIRGTTKPNCEGHLFFYDLSYSFNHKTMLDINQNIKAENLAYELSLSNNPCQQEIQFTETVGFCQEEYDIRVLEVIIKGLGYEVFLTTNSLIPNRNNQDLFTPKKYYPFLDLPDLIEPFIKLFSTGKYDMQD